MNNKYTYILGDIHGCYEELLELEEKIKAHSENNNVMPFIISCGDLIDRGPYSKEVLEHFIKGIKNNTHLVVMGNHELMMIQFLESYFPENSTLKLPEYFETYSDSYELNKLYFPETDFNDFIKVMNKVWLDAGGRETLKSFGIEKPQDLNIKISKEIIEFLINLPIYYEGEDYFITHAIANNGDFENIKSIDNNTNNSYFSKIKNTINNVISIASIPDERMIKKSVSNIIWNKKTPDRKIHEKLNISGHCPFKEIKQREIQNALQIDTGCVYGNKLTAYCVESESFLEVEAQQQYTVKTLKP